MPYKILYVVYSPKTASHFNDKEQARLHAHDKVLRGLKVKIYAEIYNTEMDYLKGEHTSELCLY